MKILYLAVFIGFIVQGVLVATGKGELSTFSAVTTSFLVSGWVAIAFLNMRANKSK